MKASNFEVIVVGAGPAGSLAAANLAAAGHDVALVDENEGPRSRIICSGIIGLEAFAHFDLPRESIVDSILRVSFFSPSGLEVPYCPEQPLAHVVDRTQFDDQLVSRAVAAGTCLLRGHKARKTLVTGRGVELTADVNGGQQLLRGKAIVVATGYRQWLHKQLNLGSPPGFVQGTRAELPIKLPEGAELYFGRGFAPGFFAWAVPRGNGTAGIGLLGSQGGKTLIKELLKTDAIRSRLNGDGFASSDEHGYTIMSRGIVQGPVDPSVADRVIAVGEAAGQVKTTTAGGIYYGLIGAELAAEVLSDALRSGKLSADSLSSYQHAWRSRLDDEIQGGLQLQQLAKSLSDRDIDELFRVLQKDLAPRLRQLVSFDWHRRTVRALLHARRIHSVVEGAFLPR
jgi:geranylgeranyl reductase family protein